MALIRIKQAVKGIEGAFPNEGYTVIHFCFVISILIFNIMMLVDTFLHYMDHNNIQCKQSIERLYFSFAVLSISWDIDELLMNTFILYVILSLTDPSKYESSTEFEDAIDNQADDKMSPRTAEKRKKVLEVL